jgi:hypothetical protein
MASMTYLQLCQLTHRLIRAGNAQAGTKPSAIPVPANQDQIEYDIAAMVPRAWEWVQNEHPSWLFMRKQGSFSLTAGTRTYTLATIQAAITDYYGFIPFYASSSFPYYFIRDPGATTVQDYPYAYLEYIQFRGLMDRRPRPANFIPTMLTEWPDKTIEVDPAPNLAPSGGNWQIGFDYRRTNQVLTLQDDVPLLPPEFHELIAWVAVRMLAEIRQEQSMVYSAALREIDSYMNKLKARYLPVVTVSTGYA